MLRKLGLIFAALALFSMARADEPIPAPKPSAAPETLVSRLNAQVTTFETAVRTRDAHSLHAIDESMKDEGAALQKAAPAAASDDQKKQLGALGADLAKQAERAHQAAHKDKWGEAADAQKQFAAAVRQIAALLAAPKTERGE